MLHNRQCKVQEQAHTHTHIHKELTWHGISSHTSLTSDPLYCHNTAKEVSVFACVSSKDILVESRNSGQSVGIKEAVTGKKSTGIISYGEVNVYGKGRIEKGEDIESHTHMGL